MVWVMVESRKGVRALEEWSGSGSGACLCFWVALKRSDEDPTRALTRALQQTKPPQQHFCAQALYTCTLTCLVLSK
jgi:hypothetical protein